MNQLFSQFTIPLKIITQPVVAVAMGIILNLFIRQHPEHQERMKELAGKLFMFYVEDLEQEFYMLVESDGGLRFHGYSDDSPNVTMEGKVMGFLALLTGSSDPDSLFFSRKLKLSGETDTGLRFKNILDNIDIDWEQELGGFITPPVAKLIAGAIDRARQFGNWSRDRMEAESEQWLDGQGIPRKSQLDELRTEAEAVAKRVEKLERALSRVTKKLALAGE